MPYTKEQICGDKYDFNYIYDDVILIYDKEDKDKGIVSRNGNTNVNREIHVHHKKDGSVIELDGHEHMLYHSRYGVVIHRDEQLGAICS